jgi:hypothetical protein
MVVPVVPAVIPPTTVPTTSTVQISAVNPAIAVAVPAWVDTFIIITIPTAIKSPVAIAIPAAVQPTVAVVIPNFIHSAIAVAIPLRVNAAVIITIKCGTRLHRHPATLRLAHDFAAKATPAATIPATILRLANIHICLYLLALPTAPALTTIALPTLDTLRARPIGLLLTLLPLRCLLPLLRIDACCARFVDRLHTKTATFAFLSWEACHWRKSSRCKQCDAEPTYFHVPFLRIRPQTAAIRAAGRHLSPNYGCEDERWLNRVERIDSAESAGEPVPNGAKLRQNVSSSARVINECRRWLRCQWCTTPQRPCSTIQRKAILFNQPLHVAHERDILRPVEASSTRSLERIKLGQPRFPIPQDMLSNASFSRNFAD